MPRNATITVYRGARNAVPIARDELSWDAFVAEVEALCREEDPATDKRDLVAFGPYRLAPGTTRAADNVEAMSAIAMLDVDHEVDLGALRERIRALGVAAIVHGSPSDDEAGDRRVRVYVALDDEHAPSDAGRVRRAVAELLGVCDDPATHNADRIGFVGRLAGTAPRYVERFDGAPIALAAVRDCAAFGASRPVSGSGENPAPITRPTAANDAAAAAIVGALGPAAGWAGSKHRVVGALGGILRKCGWPRDVAGELVRTWIANDARDVDAGVRWATAAWDREASEVSGRQALDAVVGADVGRVIEECALLPWRARGAAAPDADRPPAIDAGDYATLRRVRLDVMPPPMRYVVPALELAPGKVSAIQGFANAGKTPFALVLATCVAAGIDFLGMSTVRTSVAYFDHEASPLTQERAIRIRCGLGLDVAPAGLHLFNAEPFSLALIADARQAIADHQIGMIVIDTYSSALPDDGGSFNDSTFRSWATALGRMSAELDVVVVILLHEAKTGSGLRAISGHGSLAGALQAAIALTHPDEEDVARVRVSCARATRKGFAPFDVVWSDSEDATAPTGDALVATREAAAAPAVTAPAAARNARAIADTRTAGEAIMRSAPRGVTVPRSELIALGGESRAACVRAIQRLVAAGLIAYSPPAAYGVSAAGATADALAIATALGAVGGFQR